MPPWLRDPRAPRGNCGDVLLVRLRFRYGQRGSRLKDSVVSPRNGAAEAMIGSGGSGVPRAQQHGEVGEAHRQHHSDSALPSPVSYADDRRSDVRHFALRPRAGRVHILPS